MTPWIFFILLTIFQFLGGHGIIALFRIRVKPSLKFPLALILGVAVSSLVPFLMQLLHIPLNMFNVWIGVFGTCLLIAWLGGINGGRLWRMYRKTKFSFRLYELPALLIIIFAVSVSAWRSYYLPPTPRDLNSGPEVIAEYTVKESTMINSVFKLDLSTTNNQFKPAYLTSLQVIYKHIGFPFGQVWLFILYSGFLLFLYHALRLFIHRLLAGWLLVFFIAIPEMYAYSFMALFDLPNAIYFFLSFWFLNAYFHSGHKNELAFAGLLMAFATYTRSETLFFAGLLFPAITWHYFKKRQAVVKRTLIAFAVFILPSVITYLLSITLYIKYYLPSDYAVSNLVNSKWYDVLALLQRFADMNWELILSWQGILYYGYFFFIFLLVMILDLVFIDHISRNSRNWLYAALVIYLGYPLLGHLLPLLDIHHSTKRGLFKIFPLMLLYMGSCRLLVQLSRRINNWESTSEIPEKI